MTNEEKQALIEYCERVLKGRNNNSPMEQVYKIALAALTAQPVKLPAPYGMQDYDKWLKQSEVESAIREAGYEVQE